MAKKSNDERIDSLNENNVQLLTTNNEVKQELVQDEVYKLKRQRRRNKDKETMFKFEKSRFAKIMKDKVWPILVPFFIVMIFLVILPLIAIIVYAIVKPTGDPNVAWKISFDNFGRLFTNGGIMMALGLSIAYALCASLICVVIGYPIAYIMAALKSKILAKNVWVLVTMPIWISMLLKVLGLQSLFYLLSPTAIGTPIAIIIGMVYMFLPFAIGPIYDSVMSRNTDLEEAAKDLGCSQTRTFWTITIRETVPGMLTGFSLVIVQASTSLIVVHYLGAGKINLISSIIESYFFKGNDFGYGAAIAVVLTVLVFLLMLVISLITNKFENRKKGKGKWKNSSKALTSQS